MVTQPVLERIFISFVFVEIHAELRLVCVHETQSVVMESSVFAHVASRVGVAFVRVFSRVRDEKSLEIRRRVPKKVFE